MSKKIKIKRFDKSLPLPEYKTKGAAGFDLTARETVVVNPGEIKAVPLNIATETPRGYFLLLCARSSTRKLGIRLVNGVGIIDSDYRGDDDEIAFGAQNFIDKPVTIEKGMRIAQGILVKFTKAKWQEVLKMKSKTRGGFGSTGHK